MSFWTLFLAPAQPRWPRGDRAETASVSNWIELTWSKPSPSSNENPHSSGATTLYKFLGILPEPWQRLPGLARDRRQRGSRNDDAQYRRGGRLSPFWPIVR